MVHATFLDGYIVGKDWGSITCVATFWVFVFVHYPQVVAKGMDDSLAAEQNRHFLCWAKDRVITSDPGFAEHACPFHQIAREVIIPEFDKVCGLGTYVGTKLFCGSPGKEGF